MPPSRRTGVSRPVAKAAPVTKPSIPQSTMASKPAAPPPARPAAAAPPPPAAAPHASSTSMHAPPPAMAPPPAQAPAMGGGGGGGMLSGLAGSVMSGMAMGTGSALANRAIDGVMGPRTVEHVHTNAAADAAAPAAATAPMACGNELKSFQECVSNAGGDVSACQFYMDMLTNCKKSFPAA